MRRGQSPSCADYLDVDADQVGLVGASQAGWIAPRAAVETDAAFVALASAPTVPERTANLYERLAAGEEGELTRDEIASRVEDAGSDGFDPLPDLQHMTMPSLWLSEQPTTLCPSTAASTCSTSWKPTDMTSPSTCSRTPDTDY